MGSAKLAGETYPGLIKTTIRAWMSKEFWGVLLLMGMGYFIGGFAATSAGESWFYPIGFLAGAITCGIIKDRFEVRLDD